MNGRISPNLKKGVCGDPRTAEAIQNFQWECRDPRTADLVQILKVGEGSLEKREVGKLERKEQLKLESGYSNWKGQ